MTVRVKPRATVRDRVRVRVRVRVSRAHGRSGTLLGPSVGRVMSVREGDS